MAEQIPNARLALIPGAAHLANTEQPGTFNQIVAAFASELGKGKQSCPQAPVPILDFSRLPQRYGDKVTLC
jgi:hypothetical protein